MPFLLRMFRNLLNYSGITFSYLNSMFVDRFRCLLIFNEYLFVNSLHKDNFSENYCLSHNSVFTTTTQRICFIGATCLLFSDQCNTFKSSTSLSFVTRYERVNIIFDKFSCEFYRLSENFLVEEQLRLWNIAEILIQ